MRLLRSDQPRFLSVLRIGTAAVWIIFGLGFKVLGLVPRHEAIVATVIGPAWAASATLAIGLAELLMGLWILSGRRPLLCAAVQTLAIAAMNILELVQARDLLLAPYAMLCANAIFLGLGWFLAVRSAGLRGGA